MTTDILPPVVHNKLCIWVAGFAARRLTLADNSLRPIGDALLAAANSGIAELSAALPSAQKALSDTIAKWEALIEGWRGAETASFKAGKPAPVCYAASMAVAVSQSSVARGREAQAVLAHLTTLSAEALAMDTVWAVLEGPEGWKAKGGLDFEARRHRVEYDRFVPLRQLEPHRHGPVIRWVDDMVQEAPDTGCLTPTYWRDECSMDEPTFGRSLYPI